jgi:hypothetical protein
LKKTSGRTGDLASGGSLWLNARFGTSDAHANMDVSPTGAGGDVSFANNHGTAAGFYAR